MSGELFRKFKGKFRPRKAADALAIRPCVEAGVDSQITTSTLGVGQTSSLGGNTESHIPDLADRIENRTGELEPATDAAPQSATISERLWNIAYDSLADDENTAKLVKSYIKTLTDVIDPQRADISDELNDPIKREAYMKRLVEEGRKKISISSKTTKNLGDAAKFILSAKDMVSEAIKNIPQAALPWAGVCVGLQVTSSLLGWLMPTH